MLRALQNLTVRNEMWRSNLNIFIRYTVDQRWRWWVIAQREAERGAPRMNELVLKVIEMRLTK